MKMNAVTTGINLSVWLLEVLAVVVVFTPLVGSVSVCLCVSVCV